MKKLLLSVAFLLTVSVSFAQAPLSGQAGGTTTANTLVTIAGKKVNIETASTGQEGLVKMADAAAITAGTAGRAVDAAQLKAATNSLSALNSAKIFVGNDANVATAVDLSGQATIDNTGLITLNNDAVIAKTLTGYAPAAAVGTISSSNTVANAIAQLDKNIQVATKTFTKTEAAATVGQTTFTLTTPLLSEEINMYINGILVPKTAFAVVGATLTYTPGANYGYAVEAGDNVSITYFK